MQPSFLMSNTHVCVCNCYLTHAGCFSNQSRGVAGKLYMADPHGTCTCTLCTSMCVHVAVNTINYSLQLASTVFSLKICHSKVRHFQETSPNVFSLLTNFRFSNIRHTTPIIRQTGCVFQHFVTMLLLLVYPLES